MNDCGYFIGVDIGSKSLRAALFSSNGTLIRTHVCSISIFSPSSNFYEQRSEEIWEAVCSCVKEICKNFDKTLIKGIGFDATCSLVILDENFSPVSVDSNEKECNDVIMWMDHRAHEEAEFINKNAHEVLKFVGGKISLEMQIPKLLWLKKNRPKCWSTARHFFDLPDYLTFKATGNLSRSLCSVVCKWTYRYFLENGKGDWDRDFFKSIGLYDIVQEDYAKIGKEFNSPGDCCGMLTEKAAEQLGLLPGTPVGTSLIDAFAGGLALIASGVKSEDEMIGRLGLICGTSTCHMCVNETPIFTPGVWGPYLSAMMPNLWVLEGGQSATGNLVDHIIYSHPASSYCPKDQDIYSWLDSMLEAMASKERLSDVSFLTKDLHIYPDFHGNRSPLADPSMKGMITGLTLDNSIKTLSLLYLATIQAISYGTKDIINQLNIHGYNIHTVLMCGGLSKSKLFIQTHSNILGMPVMIPENKESVLLGAAMLGASASKYFGQKFTLQQVAIKMGGQVISFSPNPETFRYHARKYKVFKKLQQDQKLYKNIMDEETGSETI